MSKAEMTKEAVTAEVVKFAAEAENELDGYATSHRFEMRGECADKHGNLTRVLILETDPEGILEIDMMTNNPMEFNAQKREIVTDNVLLDKHFARMVNVDLSDDAVRKAVGRKAHLAAYNRAKAFFMLAAAASLPDALGMAV